MRKSCVGKYKVEEVTKIRNGKPHHHPFSFSFYCALTVISVKCMSGILSQTVSLRISENICQ